MIVWTRNRSDGVSARLRERKYGRVWKTRQTTAGISVVRVVEVFIVQSCCRRTIHSVHRQCWGVRRSHQAGKFESSLTAAIYLHTSVAHHTSIHPNHIAYHAAHRHSHTPHSTPLHSTPHQSAASLTSTLSHSLTFTLVGFVTRSSPFSFLSSHRLSLVHFSLYLPPPTPPHLSLSPRRLRFVRSPFFPLFFAFSFRSVGVSFPFLVLMAAVVRRSQSLLRSHSALHASPSLTSLSPTRGQRLSAPFNANQPSRAVASSVIDNHSLARVRSTAVSASPASRSFASFASPSFLLHPFSGSSVFSSTVPSPAPTLSSSSPLVAAQPFSIPSYPCEKSAIRSVFRSQSSNGKDRSFFVCDVGVVERQYARWCRELPGVQPFYAVKCNPDVALLKTLAGCGSGFDVASAAEMEAALSMGVHCGGHHLRQPHQVGQGPPVRGARGRSQADLRQRWTSCTR